MSPAIFSLFVDWRFVLCFVWFSSIVHQAEKVRFEPTPLDKPETTKQNFKEYLEKAGVKDALTRELSQLMIALYKTPSSASHETINFLKRAFGNEGLGQIEGRDSDLETLRLECAELNNKVEELEDENARLRERLKQVEIKADVHVHWEEPSPLEPEQPEEEETEHDQEQTLVWIHLVMLWILLTSEWMWEMVFKSHRCDVIGLDGLYHDVKASLFYFIHLDCCTCSILYLPGLDFLILGTRDARDARFF